MSPGLGSRARLVPGRSGGRPTCALRSGNTSRRSSGTTAWFPRDPDQPGRPCRSPQDARSDAIARTVANSDAGDVRASGRLHGPSDAACERCRQRHLPSASNRAKSTQTSRGKGVPVARARRINAASSASGATVLALVLLSPWVLSLSRVLTVTCDFALAGSSPAGPTT